MKKLIYLLMVLFLAACGNQQTASISSDTSTGANNVKVTAQSVLSGMENARYVPGELLVKFRSGVESAVSRKVIQSLGASVIKKYSAVPNLEHIKLPQGLSVKDAITQYMSNPDVEYAEPNYIRQIASVSSVTPNDPLFVNQWALHNTGQYAYGTAGADIGAAEAWNVSIGSSAAVVAVLDTGIDYNHSDLAGNIWHNTLECDGVAGVDDDGNGFIDDCKGWDFTTCASFDETGDCLTPKSRGNDPFDYYGHGTHVAGIIGAVGNNGNGIAGVMWQAGLLALKVLNDEGEGKESDIDDAIDYVVSLRNRGIFIPAINASFGSKNFSNAEKEHISSANAAGILFVAAAGNGGSDGIGDNNDIDPFYPASYNLPNIISVAATDQDDRRAPFSNFGATSVHVGAPGVYILSTIPQNAFSDKDFNDGTSMAAPHVSGLAGLLGCYYNTFNISQIRSMIFRYVDYLPALAGLTATGGRIDAFKAMSSLWQPADFAASPVSFTEISLSWTNRATDANGYQIDRRTDETAYSQIQTVASNANSFADGGLNDGTRYFYRINPFNDIGKAPGHAGNETSAVTPLSPPTNLKAKATSSSTVSLSWKDNSGSESGYKIERRGFGGSSVEIGQTGPNATTFTDSGLSRSSTYVYRMRAFNAVAGDSAYTDEVSVKTPSGSGHSSGGGGCSVGATQNVPTAVADMTMLLLPLVFIAALRRRK